MPSARYSPSGRSPVLIAVHGRTRRIELTQWNDEPIVRTRAAEILQELGFERDYKGVTRWRDFR